ncbi:MAG TPA: hypothetical protein VJN22_02400 [Candidatus Eremiobacteraceae bacterium]|nr:hypothetical protein [Candidatus Eremiobacteraceae bacterium]
MRNAGKIALTLGVFGLVDDSINVLVNQSDVNAILKALHMPSHPAAAASGWIVLLGIVLSFVVFPAVEAALYILFDRSMRGEPTGLAAIFRAPPRRTANAVIASFLAGVYSTAPPAAIIAVYVLLSAVINQPALKVVLGFAALIAVVWLLGLLASGVALGFSRVVLENGRVIESLRSGIALAFAKGERRRALSVGLPLAFILLVGNFGGYYLGIIAFGLTGAAAADIAVQVIGDIVAWGLTAAIATVYFRNLVPIVPT